MSGMNKVIILGNLTRDPELKELGESTVVVNFTLASNRNYTKRNGDKEQETTYVDCEAWDSAARLIKEYCSQGDPLLIEGSLKLDKWEAEDGAKRSKLKVRASNFHFVGKKGSGAVQQEARNETTTQEIEPVGAGAEGDPEIPF